MSPTPPCWLRHPLALSGELVHARGVNHVPWQPSRLRNRKEFKEKLPRYKSHPGPQRHLLPCGLGGNEPQRRFLAAYTPVCAHSFSRSDTSEGGFRALTTRDLQCLLQLECHAVAIKPQSYPGDCVTSMKWLRLSEPLFPPL